jgi:hypothetical protein
MTALARIVAWLLDRLPITDPPSEQQLADEKS